MDDNERTAMKAHIVSLKSEIFFLREFIKDNDSELTQDEWESYLATMPKPAPVTNDGIDS